MQILNGTDIDWHKKRLINKLYSDQIVKLKLDQKEIRSVKNGRGFRQ